MRRLLIQYAATRDPKLRDRLVHCHERLVHYLARRLSNGGGVAYEDLVQVGFIGLITAIERYDPEQGASFATFATPTILGVIKHYLRDHTWAIAVPRRLMELGVTLGKIRTELEARLGRSPTIAELAERVGVTEERVVEALELERCYRPLSIDTLTAGTEEAPDGTWESLGALDPGMGAVEEKERLRQVIGRLDPRLQEVIYDRFYRELSQAQVGERLGVSQMHVSRLERQALKTLRELLG